MYEDKFIETSHPSNVAGAVAILVLLGISAGAAHECAKLTFAS
jgi:hypothetical protein